MNHRLKKKCDPNNLVKEKFSYVKFPIRKKQNNSITAGQAHNSNQTNSFSERCGLNVAKYMYFYFLAAWAQK